VTRAALETLVIALQHGLTTAQAELALDVTASAIAVWLIQIGLALLVTSLAIAALS
jgi:hypothetical protein